MINDLTLKLLIMNRVMLFQIDDKIVGINNACQTTALPVRFCELPGVLRDLLTRAGRVKILTVTKRCRAPLSNALFPGLTEIVI